MPSARQAVALSLGGLAACLLTVGEVSDTLVRHVIQIAPVLAALLAVRWRPAWGAYAAIPVFGFWIFLAGVIWLYLLGVTKIISGHFSTTEILLTVLMVVLGAAGTVAALRMDSRARWGARLGALVLFLAMQVGAMDVSFHR